MAHYNRRAGLDEKTYVDADGNTVFTSAYLKARQTCCKSACLHCPYGYTLKKCGLQFADWDPSREAEARAILTEAGQPDLDLAPFLPDNVKFVLMKDHVAGLITKNHIVVKGLFLRPHFQAQGIVKEIVESYYFI